MHYVGSVNSASGGSYCLVGTWGRDGRIESPVTIDRNLSSAGPFSWNIGGHNVIVNSEVIDNSNVLKREFKAVPIFLAGEVISLPGKLLLVPERMISIAKMHGSFRFVDGKIEIDEVSKIYTDLNIKESFGISEMWLSTPIYYSEEAICEMSSFGPLERDFIAVNDGVMIVAISQR